jgi:hypothetical protein
VLTTTSAYTVAAWARATSLSADRVVLSQDGTSASGFRLMYRAAPRNAWCFGAPTSDVASPTYVEACAPTGAAVNSWTHLAGTYDNAAQTISLYVNGSLVSTAAFTTAWSATGAFVVGRGKVGGTSAGWFQGAVADPRVWARLVDATGLLALAQRSPDIPAGAVSRQDMTARYGISAPPANSTGPYALYNSATGKCVDVSGAGPGTLDGRLLQWTCVFSPTDNQLWHIDWYDGYRFTVRNPDDGYCVDVAGFGLVGWSTPVTESQCKPGDGDNQTYWLVEIPGQTGYWFVNDKSVAAAGADRSGWLCLDAGGTAESINAYLYLFPCQASGDDHFWRPTSG